LNASGKHQDKPDNGLVIKIKECLFFFTFRTFSSLAKKANT
jgi:hypothetical protein